MKAVRGTTAEERSAARRTRRGQRRLAFFTEEIRKAANGRQRLQQACQFAKAVGDELDEHGRNELAKAIAEIADRRNPR
ncbi:hypothetical protein GCM10010109_67140 [Actinoplanes campanulatus]|nr:hypothetical protein GCM10010109_67140 [Actinoplanes campanulatus]GID40195.1 hypothetical protein Aca09nite_67010 [Actinoplanes campanulatus]